MPRKQRFKPSRKPKSIPTAQAPEETQVQRSSMQRDDASRAPDEDRAKSAIPGHVPEYQDRIEAR